ncbi:MAG: GNAT family N-acetyltransferase [Candidatus Bathyarchaeota archaeon]|nr:GNAT family N-acetyltransferase [Candidatus Bathyarchaeota archaeon]
MPDEVNIRLLNENDLDAVVKIDIKVLGRERREYWKRKMAYADIYPRPALVAELNGKVVGFIMGYVSGWEFGVPDTIGWIDTLGVDPAYQRRGIGRALFNALIENFKHTGREKTPGVEGTVKPRIEGVNVVYTLANWNDWDLMQFYHAMGFRKGEMLNLKLKIR